ncbi:MAG: hypothetical protein A2W11_02790 [Ignavibacteria bacterium RBG_16_35_7]|nr:MAG: hypothetical protein A2W11_02790 [Ignavibacteria bacterium RBG_16_35_7]
MAAHQKKQPMKHLRINKLHEALVEELKTTLKTIGYNRGKNSMYPVLVREFLYFLEKKKNPDVRNCKGKDVNQFHEYLRTRKNFKKEGMIGVSHTRQFMYSLRLFFDHLLEVNEIQNVPAHIPSFCWGEKTDREVLTTFEIKKLFSKCESQKERAILSVAYGCGLRRSEIANLNCIDVNLNSSTLIVRDSKNHKSRMIPLAEKIVWELQAYLRKERDEIIETNQSSSFSFFVRNDGVRMSGEHLNNTFRKIVRRTKTDSIIKKSIATSFTAFDHGSYARCRC